MVVVRLRGAQDLVPHGAILAGGVGCVASIAGGGAGEWVCRCRRWAVNRAVPIPKLSASLEQGDPIALWAAQQPPPGRNGSRRLPTQLGDAGRAVVAPVRTARPSRRWAVPRAAARSLMFP
ncbi:hypothetical protein GCM10010349_74850 [Streptomyces flavofungini]|nr:hypothetical protein GCM10010349_74850 [Streptomyces flavofungini]